VLAGAMSGQNGALQRNHHSDKIATLAIHAGAQVDSLHGAIFPPITTATTFVQRNLGDEGEFHYSRCANPTRHAYETALMEVEAGTFCTATSSGLAATALALELLPHGSHVIVMRGLYGGTHRLFEKVRRHSMGLRFTYLDLNDLDKVSQSIQVHTRMVWVESPTNPLLDLVDIEKLVEHIRIFERLRKGHAQDSLAPDEKRVKLDELASRILVCVDNTFATAYNQRPLTLGADIVMLSSSKYVGGHSDMTGGALITADQVLGERLDALKSAVGSIASPFEAYLALRGLKTLAVRMERQCSNALRVAEFLEQHDKVQEVHYPALRSSKYYELCKRQMRSGGAVVTVRLRSTQDPPEPESDFQMMRKFFSKLRYWVLAESLGGVESMINHSATMSHASMTREERASVGVYDTTLRLSVGIEAVEDLLEDLTHALDE